MFLLVGLGNPGPRHAHNRHNIGFMALDEIVRRHGFGAWRARFHGRVAEGRVGPHKALALEPHTYMNESGRSVGEAVRFYKLDPARVVVLYDEIDLKPGKVKVKTGGGSGGHNGVRSLDAHIGRDYRRVRLGVGHPGHKDLVQPYVLHDFAKTDAAWLDKLVPAVAAELPLLLDGDEGAFMSRIAHAMAPPKPRKAGPAEEGMAGDEGTPRPEREPPCGGNGPDGL